MPDSKLVDLSAANALDGTELLYAVQGGIDVKVLLSTLTLSTSISRQTTSTTIDGTARQWNGNTDAGALTFTLPAGTQGIEYKIVNTGTSGNILTTTPDGTENLMGVNSSFDLSDGESLIIAYDITDGWY